MFKRIVVTTALAVVFVVFAVTARTASIPARRRRPTRR